MCRKLIYAAFSAAVLAAGAAAQADVFIDDFNTPRDYVANGTAGTIWDDFIGWYTGETVDALNASIDRPGQLYLASTNAVWAEPWDPLGPFLFKVVRGDFIATVQVTDYAGTPDAWVLSNDGGLMARAFKSPVDAAGPGEDWVSIDYFPIWTCGNFLWSANDNVRTEHGHNGKEFDADRYLQLERNGNVFHARTSPDGVTWTEHPMSPLTRNDFNGLPLMVGIRQANYTFANEGVYSYVAFDNFRLEVIVRPKAHDPVPTDGAKVTPNLLKWLPGDFAAKHDVYIGTVLADVNNATTSTPVIYKGRQDPNSFGVTDLIPGTTYYWRIDEVNDAHPDKLWKGDVWSFTPIPLTAWGPSPSDGTECVYTDSDLSWSPGVKAKSHLVFFGTSQTAVNNATTSSPEYKGNQTALTYALPTLAYDTVYYWRINERNTDNSISRGDVWSFRTVDQIPIADPNLVGWWTLDGTSCGNIVLDSSGYNHHGALRGNPQWVPGYIGGALEFDGRDDYVELPIGTLIGQLSNSTFMIWMDSRPGGSWVRAFDFGNDLNVYMCLGPRWWFMDDMYFAITNSGAANQFLAQPTGFDLPTGWHHVAVTINADARTIILYYDGEELARNTNATLSPKDLGNTTNNWLGRSHDDVNDSDYLGSMDDFRIYNYVLSEAEIGRAMRGPQLAWNPRPGDGSTPDIEHATLLSWSPGDNAAKHDVYFGVDPNTVQDADTSDTTGLYRGRQDPNTYSPPKALEWGKTYYWRIDEYNTDATISKGRIWSFTVADYLIIDDFEDYTDDIGNRIFQTWRDGLGFSQPAPGYPGNGSGSAVGNAQPPFAERTIVHDGLQSMPFTYDNSGATGKARYSETQREWALPQDWTRKAVKALTVWFYGDVGNSAEPLYVAVQDSLGVTGVVTYPEPDALQEARWHEWNIDLKQFAAAGVNLSSVKTMYIGVGNRTNPQAGGAGTMYFDDIRLYTARCVPSLMRPAADLNGNCVVDYQDIVILAERWLDTGLIVTPVQPASANLVGHWKFDDGFGTTAVDSSGNANNGALVGDTKWIAGHIGGALRFDGTDDYVELPIGSLIGQLSNCTFAIWANFSNAGGAWQRIFDFGTGETAYMFLSPRIGTIGEMRFSITTQGGGAPEQMVTAPGTLPSGWHHVAVTIDADKDTITLYLDGSAVAQNTQATLSPSDLGVTPNNWLGRSQYIVDAGYVGLLDEFRIYKRALAGAEVAWLAGRTAPFSIPADMHEDGVINFKDFAQLADSWLQELLWP
jgi:hypothetical protein